jgi:hypothetical protein
LKTMMFCGQKQGSLAQLTPRVHVRPRLDQQNYG